MISDPGRLLCSTNLFSTVHYGLTIAAASRLKVLCCAEPARRSLQLDSRGDNCSSAHTRSSAQPRMRPGRALAQATSCCCPGREQRLRRPPGHNTPAMPRLHLAALALLCSTALAAGRTLQALDQQSWQSGLQTVNQAAGDIFSQVSDAVQASGVTQSSVSPALANRTLDYINSHAPLWKSDLGYFIRPQVLSAVPLLSAHYCLGSMMHATALGKVHQSSVGGAPHPSAVLLRRLRQRCTMLRRASAQCMSRG